MEKEKNHAIEIYRYLFVLFVCTLHFKEYYGNQFPWGGAYLAVEFFLILSGFFEMRHIHVQYQANNNHLYEDNVKAYIVGRIKRLFPQYIVSLIILYIYRIFISNTITIKQMLVEYLPEFGMLQILGFGKFLNPAMWYVSAMLFASIIIYFLCCWNYKRFVLFIAPTAMLLIYSWFYQTNHGFGGIGLKIRTLLICDGFWRALAGMMLGCIIYVVYDRLKSKRIQDKINVPLKAVMTVIELGILILVCKMFYGHGNTVADFILVALMSLLVLSTMLNISYLSTVLNRIPINGKYAYSLYCNHWLFQILIKEFFPGHSFYPILLIYLVISFVVSILTVLLIKKTELFFSRIKTYTRQKEI